jgi:hypothetical protein
LESWQEAPPNIETVKAKMICLLDAAICGNTGNSEQATLLGVIPLLLKMLQNFKDQVSRDIFCFAYCSKLFFTERDTLPSNPASELRVYVCHLIQLQKSVLSQSDCHKMLQI